MNRRSGVEWLLDLALLAYPRAFRRRFGPEIRADFRRSAAAPDGRARRTLLRTIGGHIMSGVSERAAAVARWPLWPHHPPHLYEPRGRRAMFWDTLRSDVGHALAVAVKRPLFTGLSVAALALGIGANSAIFTVVNAVLLQPLPYRDPGRLVMVWSSNPREQRPQNVTSPANFIDYREGVSDLADLEAFASFIINDQLQTAEGPEKVLVVNAGLRIFDILGREARLGRAFAPGDTDVVVLSQGFWQRRFGGDPSIIGRTLTIGGTVRTVTGVMPEDFVFPYSTILGPDGFTRRTGVDMWTPWIPQTDPFGNRGGRLVRAVHYLAIVGRLRPDATVEALDARLSTLAAGLAQAYPDSNAGWGTVVVPLHEQAVGAVRPALLMLLGGVAVVLLMACVNVAGLALAQSVGRQREMAVRAALGAGRGRLVRQVLTESVLLSLAGAGLALLFVQWGVRGLVALAPESLPRLAEVQPDATVLAVTLGIGLASGVLIGLVPAWAASRSDLRDALQDGGRGAAGTSAVGRRLRTVLVVSEVALAVVLSVGAGLLLRSFTSLLAVDPGFRPQGLLTMQIELPERVSSPEARVAYYAELIERLRAIPGVISVGGTTRLPLGSTSVSTTIDVEGRPLPDSELPEAQFRRSIGDYFTAMGMPIRAGRGFSAEDGPTTPRVTVINEAMADRLFP
ncbi:MAG: ABC transporter permease, partial [Acidobacteriota bacterium]|nr:ABC transporter permease [Acidobacteriota bacterium]